MVHITARIKNKLIITPKSRKGKAIMIKYEVEIVFGDSFLNEDGKNVYVDNVFRKVILQGDAYTRSIAVSLACIGFGVEFSVCTGEIPDTYSYKVSNHCSLVLRVK